MDKLWPFLFLVCALPAMVVVALITPPGQSPDEPAHLVRAAGLLSGAILPVREPGRNAFTGQPVEQAGIRIDAGLLSAGFGKTTAVKGRAVVTAADRAVMRSIPWAHRRIFVPIPNTATYFPLAYLPAAFGLEAGELAGASPFTSIILARLADAAAYLAIGAASLAMAAYGRAFLLAVLLLPMSLFLGGTLDQDGILIALACLASAGLTRETSHGRLVAFAAFLVVALAKPPYLPVLAIFAQPLARPGFWRRLAGIMLASLPVLLWVAVVVLFISVPFEKPPYHPGPLYAGPAGVTMDRTDPAANLHILLAMKARLITLPWHTLRLFGMDKLRELVGVLGLLQLSFPRWFYGLWWSALVIALMGVSLRRPVYLMPRPISLLNNAATLAVIILTGWLIMLSFYLSWTNVGMDFIDGLQGRYALPLLPFLLFAVPALGAALPEWLPGVPAFLLGIFGIGFIALKLLSFFHAP